MGSREGIISANIRREEEKVVVRNTRAVGKGGVRDSNIRGDKELLKGKGVLRGPVLVVDRLCEPAGGYIVGGFIRGEGGYGQERELCGLAR
jgi:hypothetical protein